MHPVFEKIANDILSKKKLGQTLIVSIDGFGGAGKSMVATNLKASLYNPSTAISIVEMDDFYINPVEGAFPTNYDLSRLREELLDPLKIETTANYRRRDWEKSGETGSNEYQYSTVKVSPGGIVILEGIYSGYLNTDHIIWVTCNDDKRIARGIERDVERDGSDKSEVAAQWKEWSDIEKAYLEKQVFNKADCVLDTEVSIPGQDGLSYKII